MPSYKLTYFNAKARGELLRLLFAASKTKYEDVRVEFQDWPKQKEKTPQGSMPVLEVDGKFKICQSQAIARYLAREFGLYGKSNRESAVIDQIMDTCLDLFLPAVKLLFENDEEVKKKGMKDFLDATGPKILGYLVDLVKQTGTDGYAVGKSLTVGDLVIYSMYELVFEALKATIGVADNPFNKFPELVALKKKVDENKGVKEYLANRPQTQM